VRGLNNYQYLSLTPLIFEYVTARPDPMFLEQKHFAAQIAQKTQENALVYEQINAVQNTKAQAMTGDLASAVAQSVIQAMASHDAIARTLLKDQQSMKDFVGIIYDLVKAGNGNNYVGVAFFNNRLRITPYALTSRLKASIAHLLRLLPTACALIRAAV